MTRKGFLALALLPFLPKKKVNPCAAYVAGLALVAIQSAATAAIAKAKYDQTILVGGEIKWNGSTLSMELDRAYKKRK